MSISGGLDLAFDRIVEVKGDALQIYTKNQRQWRAPPLTDILIERFRTRWKQTGFMPVAVHAAYLINLATPDFLVRKRSVTAFADELQRASLLGVPLVILHPGSHLGQGVKAGLRKFTKNLDRAIARSETSKVTVLLENTAGQGTNLASGFHEIKEILNSSRYTDRLGLCFDTSHAFAAGYDIRTAQTYETTIRGLDREIGLERLRFFHLNDSRQPLGSRIDRHEHIGKGHIGIEGFRLLLQDDRFQDHPMVLETPKGEDLEQDKKNLVRLRSLLGGTPPGGW